MGLIVLILVLVLVFGVGGAPGLPLHAHYGYAPWGLGGVLLVVLVILLLSGRL